MGIFGGVNAWRIAKLKVIGRWTDFGHKDIISQLKFGWLKFGESWESLPNIPAVRYLMHTTLILERTSDISEVQQSIYGW